MKQIEQHKLAYPVSTAPFFWPLDQNRLAYGFVTQAWSDKERGPVTEIRLFDLAGKELPFSPIKDLQIYSGYYTAVFDLNQDGNKELVVLDGQAHLHAFDTQGRALAGVPAAKASARALRLHMPLTAEDVNDDGKTELILFGEEQTKDNLRSFISLFDGSGMALSGYPASIDPYLAGGAVVARFHTGKPRQVVLVQKNGDVCAFDWQSKNCQALARLDPDRAADARLCALDLTGTGAEVVMVADGKPRLQLIPAPGAADPVTPLPEFVHPGSRLISVTAGRDSAGQAQLCAYDTEHQQLVLFDLKGGARTLAIENAKDRQFAGLFSSTPVPDQGSIYSLLLVRPGGLENVSAVFDIHASAENKDRARQYHDFMVKRYPLDPSNVEKLDREQQIGLLTEQYGEDQSDAILEQKMQTDLWLADSDGHVLKGSPLSFDDLHPYANLRGRFVAAPEIRLDPSGKRLLLLLGLSQPMRQGKGQVLLTELPLSLPTTSK